MRYLHALAALLIPVLLQAAPAAARSATQAGDTSATASDYAAESNGLTTGSIMTLAEKRKKRFEDCMAIWEPATHMTKRQWRRTCNSQLDEFPNL